MSTLTMQRVTDGVLESADTARLSIMNTAGTLIVNNVTVAPTSAGVYVYDISSLTNGNYTAYWTFEVSGQQNDSVTQAFTVESPVSFPQGLMLMEIEQRVARRVGPYRKLRVKVGSTVNSLIVAKMQSRLNIGDYEEMYILRRGRKIDGSLVTNFNEDDRIRQIETYTATTGTFSPDRDWSVAPATDEEIELHSLEPDDELRDAVKLGLDECYFWDTVITSTTTYLREVNLTAIAPWITRPAQVRGVTYGRASYLDEKAPWFHAYQLGADVWLQSAVPTVGNMRIMALRPHSTFVTGKQALCAELVKHFLFESKRFLAVRFLTCSCYNVLFPVRPLDLGKWFFQHQPQSALHFGSYIHALFKQVFIFTTGKDAHVILYFNPCKVCFKFPCVLYCIFIATVIRLFLVSCKDEKFIQRLIVRHFCCHCPKLVFQNDGSHFLGWL